MTAVNIAGTALASPTNTVTVSGFTVTQIVRFSKPRAAASSGLLSYDAYSLDTVTTTERFALDSRNNAGGEPQNGGVKGGWLLPDALLATATRGAAFTVLKSDLNATVLEIYICGGIFGNIGSAAASDFYHWQGGAGTGVWSTFGSTGRGSFNHSATLGVYRVFSVHSAPSDFRMYMDGALSYSTGTNTVGFAATGKRLGWSREGGSDFQFDGKHGDVVFCRNELTTAQRQKVEGFLAWEFGVVANLDSGHPYKLAYPSNDAGTAAFTPLDLGSDLEAWFCTADLPHGTWPFNSQLSNDQTWTDRSPNAYVATLSVAGGATSTRWDTYGISGEVPTWSDHVVIYGVDGGGDHELFRVPRYPEYSTEDAAFDSIDALLPVEVSGYTSYKVTAVNDSPNQANNLGGFSILAVVVGDAATALEDTFSVEVTFSESLTFPLSDSFTIEVTTNGTPHRDPPFDCVVPETTTWTRGTPAVTAWACVAGETTSWVCAGDEAPAADFETLAYVDGSEFAFVDGDTLKLIG